MPKILIVDDDAQLRSTIQMVLKLKGYEVIDADNGTAALKLALERVKKANELRGW